MNEPRRVIPAVNEALFGMTLVSVIAVHGLMFFLLLRGRAKIDGFVPRIDV